MLSISIIIVSFLQVIPRTTIKLPNTQNKMHRLSGSQIRTQAIAGITSLLGDHSNSWGHRVTNTVKFVPETGIKVDEISKEVQFSFTVTPDSCNGMPSLHGGAAATLADVFTTVHLWGIDPASKHVSTSLELSYGGAGELGAELTLHSRVTKMGRSLAFINFDIRNQKQEILVSGTHIKSMLTK